MALPPGATPEVTVEDASRADASAPVLARSAVPARTGPPVPFVVEYAPARMEPGHQYAVVARIVHEGRLFFTTDAHHALPPPGTATPLELRLVRPRPASASTAQIENTYWKLMRLGKADIVLTEEQSEPHFVLQSPPGGSKRVTGFSGCNHLKIAVQLSRDSKPPSATTVSRTGAWVQEAGRGPFQVTTAQCRTRPPHRQATPRGMWPGRPGC